MKLTGFDSFVYYLFCILSLGLIFVYKVIVKNNSSNELHDVQFKIPSTNLGTINQTTSLNISTLYKTPLKFPYYAIYDNCIMNIPHANSDITGNHTLNVYNSTNTYGRFNDVGNSAYFNGTNTRGVVTNKDDLNIFSYNNFTLNIWMKQLKDYSTDYCAILAKAANTNSNVNRWRLEIISNNIGFIIYDCSRTYSFIGLPNQIKINDNKYHLLTFVRDGAYLYTYKDGKYMQTMSLANMCSFTTTDNLDIGCMFTTVNYDKYCKTNFGEITLYASSWDVKNILKYYDITKSEYIPMTINTRTYQ